EGNPRYNTVASEAAASANATGTPMISNTPKTPNNSAVAKSVLPAWYGRGSDQQSLECEQCDQHATHTDGQEIQPLRQWSSRHPDMPSIGQKNPTPISQQSPDCHDNDPGHADEHRTQRWCRNMDEEEKAEVRLVADASGGAKHHGDAHEEQRDRLGPTGRVI